MTVETVTCPACGHAIGVRDIVEGKHSGSGDTLDAIFGGLGCLAMIAGAVYLVSSCS